MSDHYAFSISIQLRSDITDAELAAVRYLVDGEGSPPTELPDHEYFSGGLPAESISQVYRDFELGNFLSRSWCNRNPEGIIWDVGVHLYLPGQKLEGVYGDPFALAQWLATLSASVGCIGSIVCEDDNLGIPTLLFAYKRELHMATFAGDGSIRSVATGDAYLSSDG
ncbi:MAG: hypothetical protein H7Y19_17055 [Luteimonas sp.]|nr:hypothetical protein [Luteimonas sp.]